MSSTAIASQDNLVCRFLEPVIGPPIHVADGRGGKLGQLDIVQAGEIDPDEVTADGGNVALLERRTATGRAEEMGALRDPN